jgi:hypothetical protein
MLSSCSSQRQDLRSMNASSSARRSRRSACGRSKSIEAIQTSRGGSGVDGVQVGQRRAALTGQLGTGAQLGDRTQHVAGNRQPRLPADHLRRLARTR